MKKLKEYNQKRNFDKTSEPKGGEIKTKSNKERIFVVQYHKARKEHYDFRIEWKGQLISFAVPKGLSFNPLDKRLAIMVEPHPIKYADFEGVIPKGQYGGGTVLLWDKGTWKCEGNFDKMLKEGSIKLTLYGKRLKGKFAIIKLKDDDKNWLIIKEKDEYAKKTNGISKFKTSIVSGKTSEELAKQDEYSKRNPFKIVEPMLATLVAKPPKGDDYIYEIKFDGYRMLATVENGKAKLFSRNKNEMTDRFQELAKRLEEIAGNSSLIIDGEVIVTDSDGKSDFQALQNHLRNKDEKETTYMAFDLLALNGEDLREKTILERKKLLKDIIKSSKYGVCYSEHILGNGEQLFNFAQEKELEGIVGKKVDSIYKSGRSGDWIKIKCYKRQEFVIGGYTKSAKNTNGISALLLGVNTEKGLKYIGRAGTGIDAKEAEFLLKKFKKITSKTSFFINIPKKRRGEEVFWLKPQLIAEIQFSEITEDENLRQASYKGLRIDKNAKDVILEEPKSIEKVEIEGVKIKNPNKIIYKKEKIKKIDIINYYNLVSQRMLKVIEGRVLSVVRCHENIKDAFYKKHPAEYEGANVINIKNSEGEESEYFYINNQKELITQTQLGTIEFHIWGSSVKALEKPNYMVFDFDPDKGLSLDKLRQGVKYLKQILDKLKIKSFLKTSGGKGYHVIAIVKNQNWIQFHDFAEKIAHLMEEKYPERYTTNIRKINRKGKIFVDFMRNTRGATSVAPYSLRARPGAKVSMPISWTELDKVRPDEIDMVEAVKRLKQRDPWAELYKLI